MRVAMEVTRWEWHASRRGTESERAFIDCFHMTYRMITIGLLVTAISKLRLGVFPGEAAPQAPRSNGRAGTAFSIGFCWIWGIWGNLSFAGLKALGGIPSF